MTRADAPLTPIGRTRLAELIMIDGWWIRRAAERFQVSPATASKWARRYREGQPMTDASSRPASTPHRTPISTEQRIVKLRFTRRWGPHRIGYYLGIPRSTVGRVLDRYKTPLLGHLNQATGLPVRRPPAHRYEATASGNLVHIVIKKLGRTPHGVASAPTAASRSRTAQPAPARDRAARAGATGSRGYTFLYHAVDSYSRLVYSGQLPDERKETAAGFYSVPGRSSPTPGPP